jgi:hypothetical protein
MHSEESQSTHILMNQALLLLPFDQYLTKKFFSLRPMEKPSQAL